LQHSRQNISIKLQHTQGENIEKKTSMVLLLSVKKPWCFEINNCKSQTKPITNHMFLEKQLKLDPTDVFITNQMSI